MKKILFIAPNYYGFCDIILKGLQEYSDCRVEYINPLYKFQYKNLGEKIHNFFLKNFFGKNLKIIRKNQRLKESIAQKEYDILVVIGAYDINEDILDFAISKAKHSISILWDSIAKIPSQEQSISKFDVCYSFDREDCTKYNLLFNPNFYFVEKKTLNHNFEISYLATYDNRISETFQIINYFNKKDIKSKTKILVPKNIKPNFDLPKNVEIIHDIIPFSESHRYYLDSKIILDISHSNQLGLSFRPFEAIGLEKKLITTNKDIINYDFYNPNNIFVIEDIHHFDIPASFLESDYQDLPTEIKEKYHIKNWIKRILSTI